MLVLSRELKEEIVIDHSIHIKVLKVGQSQVRLGISAPQGIPIRRAGARKPDSRACPKQKASGFQTPLSTIQGDRN
jgi:carbon storage regulator CsrA